MVISNATLALVFAVICVFQVGSEPGTGITFAVLALAAANGTRLQQLSLGRSGFLGMFNGTPRVHADIEGEEHSAGGSVTKISNPSGSRMESLPSRPPDPEPDPTV
jgi:hypothetical protein